MNQLRYLVPERLPSEAVEAEVGKKLVCPFCKAQTTESKGDDDSTWVRTPPLNGTAHWMCLGCCIDIYSTCLDDEFDDHPYRSIVADAARVTKVTESEFRLTCLQEQLSIATDRFAQSKDPRYADVTNEIEKLLASLEGNMST